MGFQDLACFRNDVGEFFDMELSEKAAFLFSETYLCHNNPRFQRNSPGAHGPKGHGANDPVMAATCARAWLPQWASNEGLLWPKSTNDWMDRQHMYIDGTHRRRGIEKEYVPPAEGQGMRTPPRCVA